MPARKRQRRCASPLLRSELRVSSHTIVASVQGSPPSPALQQKRNIATSRGATLLRGKTRYSAWPSNDTSVHNPPIQPRHFDLDKMGSARRENHRTLDKSAKDHATSHTSITRRDLAGLVRNCRSAFSARTLPEPQQCLQAERSLPKAAGPHHVQCTKPHLERPVHPNRCSQSA